MSPAPPFIRRDQFLSAPETWVLTGELVSESVPHEYLTEYLKSVLRAWAVRAGRSALVARKLAIHWDEAHTRIGVDPDVAVFEPPPPDASELKSLRLWEPGHVPPLLAVEVVNQNHPYKDYGVALEKHAVCGAAELWVLDPLMCGPQEHGGPYRIQVWRWLDQDRFGRVYAGEGPAWSEAVQGWVHATRGGSWFAICADESGEEPWPTLEEAAERRADAERAAREAAERRAEALQRELDALKAQLGRSG